MKPHPLIIVGSGLSGYHLAKEFRKLNTSRELIVITEEEGHFYSKPQLSLAVAQNKTPEQLIITPAEKMKEQLNITLLNFSRVIEINKESNTLLVNTPTGTTELRYGELVLALGAKPKPFPLLDNFSSHFRVNRWQDYDQFRSKLSGLKDLTIIGSGLVGTEFAYDFSHHDHNINVVTPDPHPLFGLVPEVIGHALQGALEQKGVKWFTQRTITAAEEKDAKLTLQLSDNHVVETDAVLTAIGLLPEVRLASLAGLRTNRGIVVTDYLQTNGPSIFALGDCVEMDGICRQYVAPILQSARVLAQTLNGQPTRVKFPAFAISLKVNAYPIICIPPHSQAIGEWQISSEEHSHKALFVDPDGQLLGYVLSGRFIEERQSCLTLFQSKVPVSA